MILGGSGTGSPPARSSPEAAPSALQARLSSGGWGRGDLQSSPAHLSRPHLTPTAPLPRGGHPSMHHPLLGSWYFLAFTPVSVLHLLPGINSPIPTLPSIFSPFKYNPALRNRASLFPGQRRPQIALGSVRTDMQDKG